MRAALLQSVWDHNRKSHESLILQHTPLPGRPWAEHSSVPRTAPCTGCMVLGQHSPAEPHVWGPRALSYIQTCENKAWGDNIGSGAHAWMSTSPHNPLPSILPPLLMELSGCAHDESCLAAPSGPKEVSPSPPLPPAQLAPRSPPHRITEIYEPDLHYEVSDLSVCQGERFKTELYGRGKRFLPN